MCLANATKRLRLRYGIALGWGTERRSNRGRVYRGPIVRRSGVERAKKVFTVMRRHLFARIPTRSGSVSGEDLVARIFYRRQSFRGTG